MLAGSLHARATTIAVAIVEELFVTGVFADDPDAVFIPIADDGFHGVEMPEGGRAGFAGEVVAEQILGYQIDDFLIAGLFEEFIEGEFDFVLLEGGGQRGLGGNPVAGHLVVIDAGEVGC